MKDTKRLMGKQALGEKWTECGFALKGGGGYYLSLHLC